MDRRRLLAGLAALAVSQVACRSNTANALQIMTLKGVLPSQLLNNFKSGLAESEQLRLITRRDWAELFQQLQAWHPSAHADATEATASPSADWVCLSDYWLLAAIQQQLIAPLQDIEQLPGWSTLSASWPTLLRRNDQGLLADAGSLWAAPYRWRYLTIVYSRRQFERLGWQPSTWQDLLNPDIQGRLALPNHPRLVLGMMLKAGGHSVNDPDPTAYPDVVRSLATLASQVKVYSSDYYLQALIKGDIWLAVGWSTEIQPLLSQYRQLSMVAPDPGTLLSADVWVKPNRQAEAASAIALTELEQKWLAYWWQPAVITPLTLFSQGVSPRLLTTQDTTGVEGAAEARRPTAQQLEQSEFITPLAKPVIARYDELWRRLRRGE
ncbi:MAG: extracellular solute-binding protein [Cyanobacteria bacterium P01_D01_bin.115]